MKRKLYYLLFPLYLIAAVWVFYINGVFTGNLTSRSNLVINAVFLLAIGVLFQLSTMSFRRLNHCTDELMRAADTIEKEHERTPGCLWEKYRERRDVFLDGALEEAFAGYQKRMAGKRGGADVCDIEEYINEEFLDRVGMAHYNSVVSGTLTGLGILGTFLGLSMGLSSFDGNDIYTISDNVGPLLEGMKVAFHTSVYGIFFSLVFNFVYRGVMSDAYERLSRFLSVYREYVAPSAVSAGEGTRAMLVYQSNMAASLKTITELLSGNAAEQTKGVERMVNQFADRLMETFGTQTRQLGAMLAQACESQVRCAQDCRDLTETVRELQGVNGSVLKALENMQRQQEQFAVSLGAQQEKLSATCDALSGEISSQLYTLEQMRNSYEE